MMKLMSRAKKLWNILFKLTRGKRMITDNINRTINYVLRPLMLT